MKHRNRETSRAPKVQNKVLSIVALREVVAARKKRVNVNALGGCILRQCGGKAHLCGKCPIVPEMVEKLFRPQMLPVSNRVGYTPAKDWPSRLQQEV
mmetsp:Transcript_19266/g.41509  ORF Transcript_19266/g.41509 Transcript_19266/m.41509 type:complete len:97 (+) Transcript_19266:505-795(+)